MRRASGPVLMLRAVFYGNYIILTSVHCHKSSHTKFLQQISKQTKEIFRGVFFQMLCYQTEIKVDSIPPVVFFDRHGHFSFNE